ncbi:MAG: energy-coupling factor ABC transporter substrate-binding protein [Rhodocyclaceae bacterium]|nr:MAG: energy-coupling factor ABC transporter substrate-binding protein [Rhodocyclaceae bacterium]
MKRHTNLLLLIAVVLLAALPLWLVKAPAGPDGQPAGIFGGADNQAREMITKINPDYRPWFQPLLEPASDEIASLLFALQAAVGAGFIGYYLGMIRTRQKMRQAQAKEAEKDHRAD